VLFEYLRVESKAVEFEETDGEPAAAGSALYTPSHYANRHVTRKHARTAPTLALLQTPLHRLANLTTPYELITSLIASALLPNFSLSS
jgi:hypothetical protein